MNIRQLFGFSPPAPLPPGERCAHYLRRCEFERRFKADEFFDLLLEDALHWRATDIHVVPMADDVAVRLRVDGALRDFARLKPKDGKFLAGRVKVVGGMDILNYFSPQDGAGRLEVAGEAVSFRASTIPVQSGTEAQERIILRLFTRREFELANLGFGDATLAQWRALLNQPQGMLILTGPANSGKTTTIYSSLLEIQRHSNHERNIATVEDPVEFPVPGLSQSQVNATDNFGFPQALRAMMRQDPQVIMIGEIRDPETARIAVEASLTGHLVLTTVHAKQVTGIFPRLNTLGVDSVRAASAVLAVLNQRLLRLNCPQCAQSYTPTSESLKQVSYELEASAAFARGTGCEHCGHTGFYGRTTVSELLIANAALRSAVCAGVTAQELYQQAMHAGMTTLWHNAIRLAISGQVPLEETLQAVGVE